MFLFLSRFVVSLFLFVLIDFIACERSFEIKCFNSLVARDQKLIEYTTHRPKRFVLFPEYRLWLHDWRYLNRPKHFRYWISNYYPQKIDTNIIRLYIHHIIDMINEVIDDKIVSAKEAISAEQSNFNFNFFNYEICPSEDPSASKDVENAETMLIYSPELIRENRYRAHGGIRLHPIDDSPISHVKFNLHHQFIISNDLQYDSVIYTCSIPDERDCVMDLYSVMLHEMLHGFGIEHTPKYFGDREVTAVMGLYVNRILCHDDIRAIRMVYGLPITRENIQYDTVCRRDFPMTKLQRFMYRIDRWIRRYIFLLGSLISFLLFLTTMIYILFKPRCLNREISSSRFSIQSDYSEQSTQKQRKPAINAFLWHDDLVNS